jgi:hypothetical protein
MSELKFYCPRCNQKIVCDELLSGQQVQCPSCQVTLMVPQAQSAAASPPPAPAPDPIPVARRAGLSPLAPAAPAPAPAPARMPVPPVSRIPQRPPAKAKSGGGAATAIKIAVLAVVLVVCGYFGFMFAHKWQNKLNEKSDQAAKNSDGGEVGHISELYSVLDATDPNKFSRYGDKGLPAPASRPGSDMPRVNVSARLAGRTNAAPDLPLIPAVWTLDLAAAKIPAGRANGILSGTNFVVDSARVDKVGQAYVLGLRQGTSASADRELLIYLHLNSGETLAGHSWEVSTDMKGAKVPQIVKRWKTNPKFAPLQKSFAAGYAMKLELGPLTDDTIPGKIFIALPDAENSVVAGVFTVEMGMPNMTARAPDGSFPNF